MSELKMQSNSQNIYDNPEFFSAYSTLSRSQQGLAAAPEWPSLRHMILGSSSTTLPQSRVLDLGCGYGWFVRWARENGASYIQGIDISEKMIEKAKSFDKDAKPASTPEVSYEIRDLETLILDEESYDFVYSSLTFHYIEDLARLLRQIHSCLKKGNNGSGNGKLVFSVEHPIYSSPVRPAADWIDVKGAGEEEEGKVWPLNSYSEEGLRVTSWLGTDGVRKYHRTTETYVSLLLENGFVLTGLKDWAPSEEDVAAHPEWSVERHRPFFLLLAAEAR
jgi:SAM-dependent methyltransferase